MRWQPLAREYMRGTIATGEVRWRMFTVLNAHNVAEFLSEGPRELVTLIVEALPDQPMTEEDWNKQLIFGMEMKDPEAFTDSVRPAWRNGVEAMRHHLRNS
jgi:hypothetical protein